MNQAKIPTTHRVLRIAVALQCVALGYKHLFGETPINDFLVLNTTAGIAHAADQIVGILLVFVAGIVLVRPTRTVLAVIALWFLLFAGASWITHATDSNRLFYQLSPISQAVRWASPLALIALMAGRSRAALWILLLATAGTFVGHGIKDWLLYPPFIDLINNSLTRIGQTWPPERTQLVLRAIGVFDIVAVALLLLTRWRSIALVMAAWGLISALSRMTAGGWGPWNDSLLRVCNAAAPFVVFLLLCYFRRTTSGEDQPSWDFQPSSSDSSPPPSPSGKINPDIYA